MLQYIRSCVDFDYYLLPPDRMKARAGLRVEAPFITAAFVVEIYNCSCGFRKIPFVLPVCSPCLMYIIVEYK